MGSDGIVTVLSSVNSAFGVVSGNGLLLALFSATLFLAAFKIIKRARNSVD